MQPFAGSNKGCIRTPIAQVLANQRARSGSFQTLAYERTDCNPIDVSVNRLHDALIILVIVIKLIIVYIF